MKKIRIMLTAIVVLAVVGGALAFKANKSQQRYCFYLKTVITIQSGLCDIVTLITNTDLYDPSTTTAAPSTAPYATTLPTLTNTTEDVVIACPVPSKQTCDTQITNVSE